MLYIIRQADIESRDAGITPLEAPPNCNYQEAMSLGAKPSLHEYQWHVGTMLGKMPKPIDMKGEPFTDVVEIRADGEELAFILSNSNNLPVLHGRSVVWKAPWAQFIYDNL